MKDKILLSLLLLLNGCATTGQLSWSPEYRDKVTSRVYNYPYGKVFNVVITVLEDSGYAIEKADKSSGKIETAFKYAAGFIGGSKSKIYAKVEKVDNNSTKVKLHISYEARVVMGGSEYYYGEEMIKEKHYASFLNAIENYLSKNGKK